MDDGERLRVVLVDALRLTPHIRCDAEAVVGQLFARLRLILDWYGDLRKVVT